MMIYKACCESMDGGFGRSIMCKKGKSITRISIYSSKNVVLSMGEVVQYSQPATRLLAGHLEEWCHIWGSVLVSAVGRSGIQQQL